MNKLFLKVNILLFITLYSLPSFAAKYLDLSIYQVTQRVLDRYPSLKISSMQEYQSSQRLIQAESSLGWALNSSAGVTHDLTGLGTPSDRLDISSSIGRKLLSGSTVNLSAGYRYEDSSIPFGLLPNPAHTTRIDLNYRMPLSQGNSNPIFKDNIISAESSYNIAKANSLLVRLNLANNIKDIFYSSVLTRYRMKNTNIAIKRTVKLKKYINKKFKLGLSEKKDVLQINAQLNSKYAELSALEVQWKKQRSSLNRLMLEQWGTNIRPVLLNKLKHKFNATKLVSKTIESHPVALIALSELTIAESKVLSAKDKKKDSLDLVMSVGSRTSDGDNVNGAVSEQDWSGSVTLEYKHLFDDTGLTSALTQSLVQKNIALENIKKINDDIKYSVYGLVDEINAATRAVNDAYKNRQSESLKLKEAEDRFRTGRADTAQLIQFQNEYSLADLTYHNQKVALNSRVIELQIFSGLFWNKVKQKVSTGNY